jgi:SAM-dependent methyltransferase
VSTYLYEHTWEQERRRLALLEEIFDPDTEDYLGRIPIPVGGSCLEVGGGAGSIAGWLCRRVGPEGRVVATDLDTGFLDERPEPNLEVRRHNIVADDLETDTFDLVHARLVLEHLPERDRVLSRLVAALRPGGWLVLEEYDWCSVVAAPGSRADHLHDPAYDAVRAIFAAAGIDTEYGRRLPLDFLAAGLVEVGAQGRTHVAFSGTPAAEWWYLSLAKVTEPLKASGRLPDAEVTDFLAAPTEPGYCTLLPTTITAWGRKPTLHVNRETSRPSTF